VPNQAELSRAEPSRAEPWRVAHRIASHRVASPRLVCFQAKAIKSWMKQEWGRVTWQRQQWHHAFQQWRNNWSVSLVSDQGFIGKTEASSGAVNGEFSVGNSREKFVSCELWADHVNWRLYVWHLKCESVIIPVFGSFAGKRQVETEKSYCVCNGEL
jgi:hypothetical protein